MTNPECCCTTTTANTPPDEVLVNGNYFRRDDLPAILAGHMDELDAAYREAKRYAMQVEELRSALTELKRSPDPTPDQEVPREEWASIKPGSRVRVEYKSGATLTGTLVEAFSDGALLLDQALNVGLPEFVARIYLISEPADPDADLIERVAADLKEAWWSLGWPEAGRIPDFSGTARAVLATVREADQ